MGYLSLYRKWRPKNFDELTGQTSVVKTLKNALLNNRIAHAYLFCGPRGTGKTSMAKVFAKALNCIKGPTIEPCNQCFSCQQINSGRSVDVIEIDAASNRGVNEIRDLREKVKYSPSEGDYKVYIIDEVHMLTKEAFNALLKTLEEPPENVVFILATTEPHKVIPTIQSRCQRFDFGLFAIRDLKARLQFIAEKEGIEIGDGALTLIARTAEGGMRDAISILDQAIAYGGDRVTIEDVVTILGKVEQQVLADLVKAVARHDTESCLKLINQIADQGKDLNQFIKDLLFHFRDLMLIKECGLQNTIIDLPEELKAELEEQARRFTVKEVLRIMEILSETDQSFKFASQPKLLLEMGMIKLASPEVNTSMTNLITRLAKIEDRLDSGELVQTSGRDKSLKAAAKPIEGHTVENDTKDSADKALSIRSTGHPQPKTSDLSTTQPAINEENPADLDDSGEMVKDLNISFEELEKYWDVTMDFLNKFKETRQLRAFLLKGKPYKIIGDLLYIVFPESSTFHKTHAEKETGILERAFKKVIGKNLRATCIFEGEEPEDQNLATLTNTDQSQVVTEPKSYSTSNNVEDDSLVQKALQTFGGKIIRVEKE